MWYKKSELVLFIINFLNENLLKKFNQELFFVRKQKEDQNKSNISNNNKTINNLIEYYSIGNGYKTNSKYVIQSFSLSKIILVSYPIITRSFSPKGDFFRQEQIVKEQ